MRERATDAVRAKQEQWEKRREGTGSEWEKLWDGAFGQAYWYHTPSGASSWEDPSTTTTTTTTTTAGGWEECYDAASGAAYW